jgi:hypothetical protein
MQVLGMKPMAFAAAMEARASRGGAVLTVED